ncbi:MAG: serpin family protein [Cyanobacteriota bacterium]
MNIKLFILFSLVFTIFLLIINKMDAQMKDNTGLINLVNSNNEFAFDLYSKLKKEDENLFISPYSISTALGMTYAGADGDTKVQMSDVLHIGLDEKLVVKAYSDLEKLLSNINSKSIELTIANSLWAEKNYKFNQNYINLIKTNFGSALFLVDFQKAFESARVEINNWVEKKTQFKIKNLINKGILNDLTRLVLVNAIYFKGSWEVKFNKNLTKPLPFWLNNIDNVNVPMMYQKETFNYLENNGVQIIELPYLSNEMSMLIILPQDKDGLSKVESIISSNILNSWTKQLRKQKVVVYLPRFKLEYGSRLKKPLISMGMPLAFSEQADFSGIDPKKDIYIFDVIHKAFVEVNEEGTEAAAATAVVMQARSISMPPPIFKADHPFMFIIKHNKTGSILFIGRMFNPETKE